MEWFIKCLKNYANFSGRARRKEYWMFILFYMLLYIPFYVISMYATSQNMATLNLIVSGLMVIISLGLCIPCLAVVVRRLHDINKSGWYYFMGLIPLVGGFIVLYYLLKEGDKGENLYGPDPKALENGLDSNELTRL